MLTLIFKSDMSAETKRHQRVDEIVDQMLGVGLSDTGNVTVTDENGLEIYPWPKTKYKVGDEGWICEHWGKGDWRAATCEIVGAYPELDYDDEDRLHWRFFYVISKSGHKREVEEFAILDTLEEAEARCKENVERGW